MQCKLRGYSEVSWEICSPHIGLFWFFLEYKQQQQNNKKDNCKLQRRKTTWRGLCCAEWEGGIPQTGLVGDRSAAVDVDKLCLWHRAALPISY